MTLLVCWLVFPLVLGLLALGSGLLLERLAGLRLAGVLVLPAGLAVVVVVVQLFTWSDATAELATPAVVLLAAVGLALSLPWRHGPIDRWAVAAALGVFAVFAAPVVLSGEATFAGYIKLDDTATWLALTDHVMERGRDLSGLAPSTYEATVKISLSGGYPVGSLLPLGVARPLVGQDLAWVFQPYLAFVAAMLSLALYALVGPLIKAARIGALAAFVASQPALLFGYSLWGGVKELVTAWIVALLAAVALETVRHRSGVRAVVALAVTSAAAVDVLSYPAAVWLAPVLLFTLVARAWPAARSSGWLPIAKQAGAFVLLALLLAAPALAIAATFKRSSGALTASTGEDNLGNLTQPLSAFQLLGVWPAEDFRESPSALAPTYLLIGLVAAAAVIGIVLAYRRRAWGLPLYLAASLTGWIAVASVGSAWAQAKALAIASPAPVLCAMVGALGLLGPGRRVVGALIAATVAGGVLWSNALAYHDVRLAPRERLVELERIAARIAGEGPTMMPVYEPFAARHFLRAADAESASELRRRVVALRSGGSLPKLAAADIDEFDLDAVLTYRTLVVPRSPAASRPPSAYRLRSRGRYYEVWQRPATAQRAIIEHLPLGDDLQAAARPRCRDIRRLGRLAAAGATLATLARPRSIVVQAAHSSYPVSWQVDSGDPRILYPTEPGTLSAALEVPRGGRYTIWLAGSFARGVDVSIDGRRVGAARYELGNEGQYVQVGEVAIAAGRHRLGLEYGAGDLRPGSSGRLEPLGPLLLSPTGPEQKQVRYLAPDRSRALCQETLDWVEVVQR